MTVKRPERQLERARAMRGAMTRAETILWASVRGGQLDAKVRRKVPIGPYIADFACLAAKLVIELDGPPHDQPEQQDHDRRRDAWMRERGWRVLRVSNEVVLGDGGMVLDRIRRVMREEPSSDLASRGHLLPLAGEGRGPAAYEGLSCP